MEDKEWIIMNYTLPKDPSRIRVSTWRKLKKMGAISIGQSMWILPFTKEHQEYYHELSDEISQNNGTSYILKSTFLNEKSTNEIIEEFNKARDVEYGEVLEKCNDFFHEIDKEIQRKNFTYAEIEENEYEYNKLMEWFMDINRRDFFLAPLKSVAEQELQKCRQELEDFSKRIYEHSDEIY